MHYFSSQVGYLLPPPQLASPLAIVYCQSSKDVAATMKVAYQSGLQICVASGRYYSVYVCFHFCTYLSEFSLPF
eukprot:Awhi_evm1s1467